MPDDTFEGVTVTKRANVHYDGGVTSRTVLNDHGVRRTLGIMHPGDYVFETDSQEQIDLYAGRLQVTIDGESTTYESGDSFTIPADTTFDVSITDLVDYCCTYE